LKKGVKKKEHEKLDDATIERVITLLEDKVPISKKQACEILNITYNTSRLSSIVEEYKERQDRRKKGFERNRGKPIQDHEIASIIEWYIAGSSLSDISESLHRSPSIVAKVIENVGVPPRPKGEDAHKITLLPEECIITEAYVGQFVWSAKYHAAAEVLKLEDSLGVNGEKVYRIYVYEATESGRRGGFYASQRIEDLGSLEHLKKYVSIDRLVK
jgi:hypothetical protein